MNAYNNFTIDFITAKENKDKLEFDLKLVLAKKSPLTLKKFLNSNDVDFLNPLLFAYLNDNSLTELIDDKLSIVLDKKYSYSILFEGIEYLTELPEHIRWCFFEMYRGKMVDSSPKFEIDNSKSAEAAKALEILKFYIPEMYEEIKISNKIVVFHNNPKIINFVTKSFNGALPFWVNDQLTEVHFIEEFIHQGSHNYLNLIFHNKGDFFKENPENINMSDLTGNENDYRSVLSAIHGLYTVVKRMNCFKHLIMKKVFTSHLEHELIGRYADQLKRFKHLGVYDENMKKILSERGLIFYNSMVDYGMRILDADNYILNMFNLEWRDIDFYYSEFAKYNKYDDFKNKLKTKINI